MGDHELLIRHARAWAAKKGQHLDEDVLAAVLGLRDRYDGLAYGSWPAGSAERLLLTMWPDNGLALLDPDELGETLATFWGFLRATGRMASESATPAALRKEAARSLPKMAEAYDDPVRRSTAPGRTRVPAPDLPEMPGSEPADVHASGRLAREAEFVGSCLALADWVGEGREVTGAGFLRPAVAREAYRHLDLWPWERTHDAMVMRKIGLPEKHLSPEVDELMARTALAAWNSAGDCLPLDRLWYACVEAGLVRVGSKKATRASQPLESDEQWRDLGLTLVSALCVRLGDYEVEPLPGVLLHAHAAGGRVPLGRVREWWDARCPDVLRDMGIDWTARLDEVLFQFGGCNLWSLHDDELALTEFGRDFLSADLTGKDFGLVDGPER